MTSCKCDTPNRSEKIRQLKETIERLRQQHSDMLRNAAYIGMTREEVEVQDRRRQEITELFQQLLFLEATK